MTDEKWTAEKCAAEWAVQPRTWHSYVARGYAPAPVEHVGRTPVWDAEQVRSWQRPGRGNRGE